MTTEKFNPDDYNLAGFETVPLANEVPPEAPEAFGPPEPPVTAPIKTRSKKPIIPILAAAVILVIGGSVAAASALGAPPEAPEVPSVSQPDTPKADDKVKQSAVKLTIEAEGAAEGTATKAKVVALNDKGKEAVKETEVIANEETEIGKLDPGSYELHVTCAPVLTDGSTYKLPETAQKFEVGKDGKATVVKVKLDVLKKDDMTKEQLEAAASVLAANGNADAAGQVTNAAQSAPSVAGSADAVTKPAAPSNGGGTSTPPSNGNTGGGNSGSSGSTDTPSNPSTPAPPQHTHSWTDQYESVYVPAVYEDRWVPNYVFVPQYTCGGCGATFSTPQTAVAHQEAMLLAGTDHGNYWNSGYDEDRGSYQPVLISPESTTQKFIGRQCSGCGIWG